MGYRTVTAVPPLYDILLAAMRLGVSHATMYRWVDNGALPLANVPGKKRVRTVDLENWIGRPITVEDYQSDVRALQKAQEKSEQYRRSRAARRTARMSRFTRAAFAQRHEMRWSESLWALHGGAQNYSKTRAPDSSDKAFPINVARRLGTENATDSQDFGDDNERPTCKKSTNLPPRIRPPVARPPVNLRQIREDALDTLRVAWELDPTGNEPFTLTLSPAERRDAAMVQIGRLEETARSLCEQIKAFDGDPNKNIAQNIIQTSLIPQLRKLFVPQSEAAGTATDSVVENDILALSSEEERQVLLRFFEARRVLGPIWYANYLAKKRAAKAKPTNPPAAPTAAPRARRRKSWGYCPKKKLNSGEMT